MLSITLKFIFVLLPNESMRILYFVLGSIGLTRCVNYAFCIVLNDILSLYFVRVLFIHFTIVYKFVKTFPPRGISILISY